MKTNRAVQSEKALRAAVAAARETGRLLKKNLNAPKKINSSEQHDIKLELDVRSQQLIEARLKRTFPDSAILGEEGVAGDASADSRWVIDPIDGTVNFTYGIPHACISIAFQTRAGSANAEQYQSQAAVVYDPFAGEIWTAVRGGPARLNGHIIRVSGRTRLAESIISIGFAKNKRTLEKMLPAFNRLVHKVRKIRLMGAAALAMVYVATGRFDAYLEDGIRLWDIAAGGLILECAGGDFHHRLVSGPPHSYAVLASNGPLRKKIDKLIEA